MVASLMGRRLKSSLSFLGWAFFKSFCVIMMEIEYLSSCSPMERLTNKKRGNRTLLPVPRSKGSRIALSVETSNAESPTPMWIYMIHPVPLWIHQWLHKVQWGLYNTPLRTSTVALFLTDSWEFARFLERQNQSVK